MFTYRHFSKSRTAGDGNCLYNACSLARVGSESMAIYLRSLTSIEMYTNARYYCTHPLIEQQHKKGAFENRSNAFAMCLSDAALCSFTKQNPD